MTESENNCKCTGQVEKVIVRIPGPQGGKGEMGPQGELNPADKEFIAQKAQEATEAATGAENAKDAAEIAQVGAETSAASAKDSADKAAVALKDTQAEKTDALAKIDATVTQAKSDIQAQVTVATTQATTATQAATTATQKATEADQSAKDADASKTAAETAKASAESSAATATEQAGIATEKAEALTEAMGNLTTLSNDAVRFTAQEKTDAEKYQARKNIAASSLGEVEALKKQIANLQAQAEGKTFTYETDATEAYSKDVPEGAYPYAAVKNFGGKTIVWNQGVSALLLMGSNGTVVGNTATATPTGKYNGVTGTVSSKLRIGANHKYYFAFDFYQTQETGVYAPTCWGQLRTDSKSVNNWYRYSMVGTEGLEGYINNTWQIVWYDPRESDWTEWKVRDAIACDLTMMFGAGNEPTKEEFEAMFPENYYKYNEGELKSAPTNNLKVVGRNLYTESGVLPAEIKDVFVLDSAGDYVISFYVKDFSVSSAGSAIIATTTDGASSYLSILRFTKANGSDVTEAEVARPSSSTGRLFVTLKGLKRGTHITIFLSPDAYAQVNGEVSNLSIEKSNELKCYAPYKEENRAIPQAVLNLEGYGWSAGAVSNEIDWENKTFIKRVGKIVLDGTQTLQTTNWRTTDNGVGWGYSYSLTKHKLPGHAADAPNAICDKLQASNYSGVYYDGYGVCFYQDISYGIFVRTSDTTLTSESLINDYLSKNPITIYYELAESEVIDISDILPDDNILEVEEGGTITFENSNGDGFRIPVPSEIVYQKKVTTNE